MMGQIFRLNDKEKFQKECLCSNVQNDRNWACYAVSACNSIISRPLCIEIKLKVMCIRQKRTGKYVYKNRLKYKIGTTEFSFWRSVRPRVSELKNKNFASKMSACNKQAHDHLDRLESSHHEPTQKFLAPADLQKVLTLCAPPCRVGVRSHRTHTHTGYQIPMNKWSVLR